MPKPIRLEILSLVPITFKQCSHCENFYDQSGIGQQVHEQILTEYPPEMLEDYQRLTALVTELFKRFEDSITIQIIDPQSLRGIFKTLRFRIRKYPSFIIDGQDLVVGWDRPALNSALENH